MKISDTSGVYGPGKLKKTRKAGESDFGDFLSAAEEAESAASSSAPPLMVEASSLSPLLSLQEVSEDESRRKKSLQQGRQSVDMLDQLRREILTGQTSTQTISRMKTQAEQIRANMPPDAQLQEIMSDIELRLAVEAAKLEKINFSA